MLSDREEKLDAESRALATIFFRDDLSEGEPCRVPIVSYRLFANVGATLSGVAVEPLRELLRAHAPVSICRDLALLLRARNWRCHALASGALVLATGYCKEVSVPLWMRLRLGCAMVAQLSAAAAITDGDFRRKAQRLLTLESTSERSIAALSALLCWLDCQSSLQENPRVIAAKLCWAAVGSDSVALHRKFTALGAAA